MMENKLCIISLWLCDNLCVLPNPNRHICLNLDGMYIILPLFCRKESGWLVWTLASLLLAACNLMRVFMFDVQSRIVFGKLSAPNAKSSRNTLLAITCLPKAISQNPKLTQSFAPYAWCSAINDGKYINNEYNDVYLVTTLAPIPMEAFTLQVRDNDLFNFCFHVWHIFHRFFPLLKNNAMSVMLLILSQFWPPFLWKPLHLRWEE